MREILSTPAEHGTVLALHHPPIPLPMLRAAEVIELADQHLLADVVRDSDVRVIIGGHFHFTSWSSFAGIPVSVASASCYTSDPAPVDRFVSGVDGHQAFTMLHVYADQVVHTVVPLADAPEVSGFTSDVVAALEALDPAQRREVASRQDSDLNRGIVGPPGWAALTMTNGRRRHDRRTCVELLDDPGGQAGLAARSTAGMAAPPAPTSLESPAMMTQQPWWVWAS